MSQSSSSSSSFESRAPGVAPCERAVLVRVRVERRDVEPARRMQTPRDVGDGDHRRPERLQLRRGDAAHVAEPLDDAALVGDGPPEPVARTSDHHHDPGSRRLVAEHGAPDRDWLPRDDLGHRVAALHRVRVHHPGHRLLVRGHVGSGNVLLRADDRQEFRREATRHALELAERHRARIAAHASLRTSVRQAEKRALPGHPHRERGAFAERHLGVVADAALRRPRDARVLHAIARKDDALPAVHAHGDRDDRRALRIAQALGDVVRDAGDRHGLVELRDRHAVQRRIPLELGMGKRFRRARHGRRSLACRRDYTRPAGVAERVRRARLKSGCPSGGVRVRVPPPACRLTAHEEHSS